MVVFSIVVRLAGQMLDLSLLPGFLIASLIILALPGPGVLYVVSRSLSLGVVAGLYSAAGLAVGVFAHVAAATIGLSAILLASASLFAIVKYAGAVYLIYLGIRTIRAARQTSSIEKFDAIARSRLFLDGVIVSVFNPKISVFFLAFLPQFVNPQLGQIHCQVIILGTIYACLAFITDGTYGIFGGTIRRFAKANIYNSPIIQMISGGLLVLLGIKVMVEKNP
ncbi:MAG: LysE family translocator [Pseudomonadota bacterium]